MIKIGFCIAIVGMVALFFISTFVESDVSEESLTKISGHVNSVNQKDKMTIIYLNREDVIPVVVYSHINVSPGDKLTVTGKKGVYKGKDQLIAESVKLGK